MSSDSESPNAEKKKNTSPMGFTLAICFVCLSVVTKSHFLISNFDHMFLLNTGKPRSSAFQGTTHVTVKKEKKTRQISQTHFSHVSANQK